MVTVCMAVENGESMYRSCRSFSMSRVRLTSMSFFLSSIVCWKLITVVQSVPQIENLFVVLSPRGWELKHPLT